jgi:hypothetical protein
MVTSKQARIEPRSYFHDASVDPTEARNDILGCFGRADRSALRRIEENCPFRVAPQAGRFKIPAR